MPKRAPIHRPSTSTPQRGTAAERGYDASWRALRLVVLAEEPLCRACEAEGRVEAATVVDHVVPLRAGGTHQRANLQPLCAACHGVKTAREDGGFGRASAGRRG
jgi:5-methylcytosine-specific restriction enzyme A